MPSFNLYAPYSLIEEKRKGNRNTQVSSRSSAGALNWGHCKLKSTMKENQVKHFSCLCKLCRFGRTARNDLLRKTSAKGMEKD